MEDVAGEGPVACTEKTARCALQKLSAWLTGRPISHPIRFHCFFRTVTEPDAASHHYCSCDVSVQARSSVETLLMSDPV